VSEPFLDEVEGDTGGDGGDAEAVAQSFGRGVRPVEPGGVHDGVDGAPSGHAAPGPEAFAARLAAAGLGVRHRTGRIARFVVRTGNTSRFWLSWWLIRCGFV
jgi:hypothetical protein